MDSFYDAPRPPPVPTKLPNVLPRPRVPEVSLLCQDKPPQNAWGATKTISDLNRSPQHTQQFRKQVHFDHFRDAYQPRAQVATNLESTKDFLISSKGMSHQDECKENLPHENPRSEFNLNGKTFKQIYMANIPNRQLDLSLIEPNVPSESPKVDPKVDCPTVCEKSKCEPMTREQTEEKSLHFKNYRDFKSHHLELKTVKNVNSEKEPPINNLRQDFAPYNFLRSIENTPQFNKADVEIKPKSPTNEVEMWQNSVKKAQPSNPDNDEPTFKDLFEIVKRQNEQIMMLQQQVLSLKDTVEAQKPEPPGPQFAINSPPKEFFKGRNNYTASPKLGLPKKFSIDLKATSFEVSFRPQMNKFRKQTGNEPKIQEILEMSGGGKSDENDLSLNLQESLNVRETCQSPMQSIQINMGNMEDYETSSNEEDEDNGGMTFYQDLMAQVNNMLENVNSQPRDSPRNKIPAQKVYEVKEATLHYLKSMGVNVPPNEQNQPKWDNGLDYNPSEISFAVKQLLLKYLPDDHLAKIACRKSEKPQKRMTPTNGQNNGGLGAEFSFATVQYMKKYNLTNQNKPQMRKKTTQQSGSNNTSRILDISTLKLQPKLL